ncbi:MAG TPA: AAA family ATPase [Longimicrobium sp.]|nr:AAA family ATPase [Longimicrobium sp.]
MTYQRLLELLLVALGGAGILVLGLVLLRLRVTRAAQAGKPVALPETAFQALEFSIRGTDLTHDSGEADPGTIAVMEALRAESRHQELAIVRSYFEFSQAHGGSLERLCELLEVPEDPDAMRCRSLYRRLLALNDDRERDASHTLPSLRVECARMRPAGGSAGKGWIADWFATLFGVTDELARLVSDHEPLFAAPAEPADAPESGTLERVYRRLEQLRLRCASKAPARFRQERRTLEEAINGLVAVLPATAPGAPSGGGALPRPRGHPLRVMPEVVTLSFQPAAGTQAPVGFTIQNLSDGGLDKLQVRWSITALGDRGAAGEARLDGGTVSLGFLRPDPRPTEFKIPLRQQLPVHAGELSFHLDVHYTDPGGQDWAFPIVVPLKLVDAYRLACPYAASAPDAVSFFVGRQDTLAAVQALIQEDKPKLCVLSGLPNIGKTALLFEVQRRCQTQNPRLRVAVINLDKDARLGADAWTQDILRSLVSEITRQISVPERQTPRAAKRRHSETGYYLEFIEFLDRLHQVLEEDDLRLYLMIDEYHRVEEEVAASTQEQRNAKADFVRFLRRISEDYSRILIVLAGLHDFVWLARKAPGKVWLEVLKAYSALRLGYLEPDEALALVREPMQSVGITYAPGVAEEFSRATNGYPVLIHELGELLFKRAINGYLDSDGDPARLVIDDQVWSHARQVFLRDVAPGRFDRIWLGNWLDDSDKAICIALAKEERKNGDGPAQVRAKDVVGRLRSGGPGLSEAHIIRRIEFLEERGIVLRDVSPTAESTFRLAVPLMADWLQNQALEYQLAAAPAAEGAA